MRTDRLEALRKGRKHDMRSPEGSSTRSNKTRAIAVEIARTFFVRKSTGSFRRLGHVLCLDSVRRLRHFQRIDQCPPVDLFGMDTLVRGDVSLPNR